MNLPNDFQTQVLDTLGQINQRLSSVESCLDGVEPRLGALETDAEKLDFKFDTHQNASDQVTRLATTIVIAAAPVVVLAPVLQALTLAIMSLVSSVAENGG